MPQRWRLARGCCCPASAGGGSASSTAAFGEVFITGMINGAGGCAEITLNNKKIIGMQGSVTAGC